jgi:hypothetical protein
VTRHKYRRLGSITHCPATRRCLTTKSHQFNSTDCARSAKVSRGCRRSTPSRGRRGPWVSVCGLLYELRDDAMRMERHLPLPRRAPRLSDS